MTGAGRGPAGNSIAVPSSGCVDRGTQSSIDRLTSAQLPTDQVENSTRSRWPVYLAVA